MFVKLEFRDVTGWPMMFCDKPIIQAGDKIRIQNYGLSISNDLAKVCARQRELTRMAKEGKQLRSPSRFSDILLEAILGKPLQEYIDDEVNRKLEQIKKETQNDHCN